MIHPNVPQGHAPVPHTFSYYPESVENQLYAEDVPGSQSIEVVNNSDNFVILAFRKVQNIGFVQNNYDMIVPPWKGLVRPCTAPEITTVVMGQGNAQGLLNKVLVKAYPFSQSSSEFSLPNNSGGLPIYAPPGGLPIIGTVNVGNTPNVAVPGGVGITGTPNVAVPGGVGITGTPNVAVPGGVGITGTPNVAVPGGVGINGTPNVAVPGGVGVTGGPASGLPVINTAGGMLDTRRPGVSAGTLNITGITTGYQESPNSPITMNPGTTAVVLICPQWGFGFGIRVYGVQTGTKYFDGTLADTSFIIAPLYYGIDTQFRVYINDTHAGAHYILASLMTGTVQSIPYNYGGPPLTVIPATGSQMGTVPGTSPSSSQLATFVTTYTIASLSTGNAPFTTLSSIKWDATLINTATNVLYCRYIVGLRGQPSTKIVWYGIGNVRTNPAPSGGSEVGTDKGASDFVYPRGFSVIFPGDTTYDVVYGWFNNSPSINVILEKA